MIGRRDKGPINAVDELNARDDTVTDERGPSSLGTVKKTVPAGWKGLLLVTGATLVVIAGSFMYAAVSHGAKDAAGRPVKEAPKKVENVIKGFTPIAITGEPPADTTAGPEGDEGEIVPIDIEADMAAAGGPHGAGTVPALAGGGPGQAPYTPPSAAPAPREPTPAELIHLRRLQAGLGNRPHGDAPVVGSEGQQQADGEQGELAQSLRPLRLAGQQASAMGDRNYLLTQGSMLDCALTTRIVSSVAGMVSCNLTRDVFSANGHVVLLDKGSKVVGFYQGGARQGQPRIFVQWSRVETTKGVIVNLDSPGTGPLGEGGLGGKIDTHFRDRFGGAILLSMIDDLGDYFANRKQTSTDIQFNNSGDAAKEMAKVTLESSINIPPTLYKNQGERVSIFVARDLDFRGVYALARR